MKLIILFYFLSHSLVSYSQIKPQDLVGKWIICDDNNLYSKLDSILLIQDINHQVYSDESCCNYINWNIMTRSKIRIENLYACSEPGKISWVSSRDSFKLVRKQKKQIIIIKRNRKMFETFYVVSFKTTKVNRYPYEIKSMMLKRIRK